MSRPDSILQPAIILTFSGPVCYVTGSQQELDCHHIYAGPNRKNSDKWGCWVWLRHDIHMRLHDQDKELDYQLKRECQKVFESRWGHQKFMEVFGKSYL